MPSLMTLTAMYLLVVSLIAAVMTVVDKHAANKGSWRVRERTLLIVSAIGGSVAMFAVMRFVRHKTSQLKFMLGIPLIIIAQVAAVILVWWFFMRGAV